ncbi:hypothetical protein CR165_04670 [Pseudoroseomonas aestuarii]|uniref:Uncharacterized protein n=2 Tax=Teichococcus aestuarii TaxID=568898 RepID=A0A2U1V8C4_9PROT|nr:hypothetical protein CR165_04670 [Pseudoroseomonas aestuarii]
MGMPNLPGHGPRIVQSPGFAGPRAGKSSPGFAGPRAGYAMSGFAGPRAGYAARIALVER